MNERTSSGVLFLAYKAPRIHVGYGDASLLWLVNLL